MELKIEYVPLESLTPSADNANIHAHDQIDQIAESIELFGNCDPIGVGTDEDGDLVIIEGHGRYYALKKLGREQAPVIFLDHLDADEKRQYGILHNQLTRNSEFDMAVLEREFEAMPDFDWEGFGFDMDALTLEGLERGEPEPAGDNGFRYSETYAIEVVCESEADQERTYKALTDQGYNCRVVVV